MLICEQRSVSVCAGFLSVNVNWWCKLVDDVLRVWKWSVLDDMCRVYQFECRGVYWTTCGEYIRSSVGYFS